MCFCFLNILLCISKIKERESMLRSDVFLAVNKSLKPIQNKEENVFTHICIINVCVCAFHACVFICLCACVCDCVCVYACETMSCLRVPCNTRANADNERREEMTFSDVGPKGHSSAVIFSLLIGKPVCTWIVRTLSFCF